MNKGLQVANDQLKLQRDVSPLSSTSKTAEIIKMELQLNKMKKLLNMQIELRKNKEEFNQISQEISDVQQQLKTKKKERINEKLMQIQMRHQQRAIKNKQSNQTLAKIKEDHRQRRKRMQSLVNEYKKEYDYVYHKKLLQRKENKQLNLQGISEHQRQYLQSIRKYSNRIKTQSLDKSRQRYSRQKYLLQSMTISNDDTSLKKMKIMQLVNKRIEYGNKVEKQSIKIKIPLALIQKIKAQTSKSGYDKNIDQYNHQKQKYKKPKLNTNFFGDIHQNRYKQIIKIANEQSPTVDKLNRLRHIADGYNLQYNNGQIDALDLMSNASIARANLLLKES